MSLSNADRLYLKCNGSVCIMSWMEKEKDDSVFHININLLNLNA